MKGRWAAGIVPRNFAWILKGQLAVSERPGGYAPHHRRVRRQEEILWLRAQGFTRVVSLLPSSHNLHAYEELGIPFSHFPLPMQGDVRASLGACYPALLEWLRAGERMLLHHEELGERVAGVSAGFLCWSGLLPDPPQAISAVEHLLKRQMGSAGRAIVGAAAEMAAAADSRPLRPAGRSLSAAAASPAGAQAAEVLALVPDAGAAPDPVSPPDTPAPAARPSRAKAAPSPGKEASPSPTKAGPSGAGAKSGSSPKPSGSTLKAR